MRHVYEPCFGYYFCWKNIKYSLFKTNLLAISFFIVSLAYLVKMVSVAAVLTFRLKVLTKPWLSHQFFRKCLSTSYSLSTTEPNGSPFFCLFKDLLRNIILPGLTCTFLFYGNFFFLRIHKGLNEAFILKSVSWIKIM